MSVQTYLKKTTRVRNRVTTLFLTCFIVGLFVGCGNDIEKTKMFERKTLPDNTITQARIQRSASGKLQMVMYTPIIQQFSKPEAKTIYPKGVYMRFFDGPNRPTATLRARYAITYDSRGTMMVRDSVVIIDLQHGDTVYLKDLTWNQQEHRIFSDNPVRSKNGPRITLGDRFESDDAFQAPLIVHQRGTFEWTEE